MFLYVALAWIAVDVLLVSAWHGAHIATRRSRAGVASTPSTTPRALALAVAAHHRAGHVSPTPARPGYFRLIDA